MTSTLPTPTADRGRTTGSRSLIPVRIETNLEEKLTALFAPAATVAKTADAEALHKMRVASRRLREGLRCFEALFPESELIQVQRQLRRVTKTFGQIRSLDVNIQQLRKSTRRLPGETIPAQRKLAAELLTLRAERIGELQELTETLRTSHFEARIRTLILKPLPRDDKRLLKESQNALTESRREVRRRWKKCRREKEISPAFHKFRIAAKRYRYALETTEAVFRLDAASRIRAVEELQDRMGKCRDLEVLVQYLEETAKRWKENKSLAASLELMLAFFNTELDRSFARYRKLLAEERIWLKKVKVQLPHDD